MKILAADDDPVARLVLESALKSLDHEPILAADGEAAWELFNAEPVRVIVSDWQMPRLDGAGLCRRVRARASRDYVYFIFLSQYSEIGETQQAALEAGADDLLSKPIDMRELRMRLHVACRILDFIQQVQQLESFLPICAYCKKIRDDKNYWDQIEGYISKRTGTRFSHGICPDCYNKLLASEMNELKRGNRPKPFTSA